MKYYMDFNLNSEKTVLLAGYARSETTWLTEAINHKNTYRYIFEPFHTKYVSDCKDLNPKQAIWPHTQSQYFYGLVEKVLSGQIQAHWSNRFNKKLIGGRRPVKIERANLFLKWLRQKFPSLPIVFLIRHPCAVAASQAKLVWPCTLRKYLIQINARLLRAFSQRWRNQKSIISPAAIASRITFFWCIDYIYLFSRLRKAKFISFL